MSETRFHNNPLWYPDDTGGGFEVDFEDTEPTKSGSIDLDEFERLLRENPVARAAAAQVLQGEQGTPQQPPQAAPSTPDPLSEVRQRLAEVTQQLEQNPQDANAFAEKIKLEAQLESLERFQKLVEPMAVQQQVSQVVRTQVPSLLKELSKSYPNFESFQEQVQSEIEQQLFANPALAADPTLLKRTAELVADHYFSAHMRSQASGTALPGNRAFAGSTAPKPKVEGLSDEEAAAFQSAKQFYPDLTPEDWKAYHKDEGADTDSQYRLQLRNVVGRSSK